MLGEHDQPTDLWFGNALAKYTFGVKFARYQQQVAVCVCTNNNAKHWLVGWWPRCATPTFSLIICALVCCALSLEINNTVVVGASKEQCFWRWRWARCSSKWMLKHVWKDLRAIMLGLALDTRYVGFVKRLLKSTVLNGPNKNNHVRKSNKPSGRATSCNSDNP